MSQGVGLASCLPKTAWPPTSSIQDIKAAGLDGHYAEHAKALFYTDATGNPWTATYIQAKGDPITEVGS